MPPLGRQSRLHVDRAKTWLARAKEATTKTRSACGITLPHLVKAHEALGFAWAHIDSMGSGAKERRAQSDLQQQHREINKKLALDYRAFASRCIRGKD